MWLFKKFVIQELLQLIIEFTNIKILEQCFRTQCNSMHVLHRRPD
jgi:hypothetical protein